MTTLRYHEPLNHAYPAPAPEAARNADKGKAVEGAVEQTTSQLRSVIHPSSLTLAALLAEDDPHSRDV